MSPLLHPVRSWQKDWAVVDPLRDGRSCPACGATCTGKDARRQHHGWHQELADWLEESLRQVASAAGVRLAYESESGGGEAPGDGDKYIRVANNPAYDEDDDE